MHTSILYLNGAQVHWLLDDSVIVSQSQGLSIHWLIEWPGISLCVCVCVCICARKLLHKNKTNTQTYWVLLWEHFFEQCATEFELNRQGLVFSTLGLIQFSWEVHFGSLYLTGWLTSLGNKGERGDHRIGTWLTSGGCSSVSLSLYSTTTLYKQVTKNRLEVAIFSTIRVIISSKSSSHTQKNRRIEWAMVIKIYTVCYEDQQVLLSLLYLYGLGYIVIIIYKALIYLIFSS